MKPFDLAAAKVGKPVVTDSGLPVRIIAFDRKGTDLQLVTLVQTAAGVEELLCYNIDGTCPHRNSAFFLRMAPIKREGWANIYPTRVGKVVQGPNEDTAADGGIAEAGLGIWPTRVLADKFAGKRRIACVRVEWEE